MDTKGEKQGRGGGGMNWEIGIDIYTLMCIKLMTNKNLLFKKKIMCLLDKMFKISQKNQKKISQKKKTPGQYH